MLRSLNCNRSPAPISLDRLEGGRCTGAGRVDIQWERKDGVLVAAVIGRDAARTLSQSINTILLPRAWEGEVNDLIAVYESVSSREGEAPHRWLSGEPRAGAKAVPLIILESVAVIGASLYVCNAHWIADFCNHDPNRLYGVAHISLMDPEACHC